MSIEYVIRGMEDFDALLKPERVYRDYDIFYNGDVVLKRGYASLLLSQFLPPRHTFEIADVPRFGYEGYGRRVLLDDTSLHCKGFLLSLFHEIGHAHYGHRARPVNLRRIEEAHEERAAWAYALRQLRELRLQGFDALADFDDWRDADLYISTRLCSYEWQHAASAFSIAGTLLLQNYKPAFEKRARLSFDGTGVEGEDMTAVLRWISFKKNRSLLTE